MFPHVKIIPDIFQGYLWGASVEPLTKHLPMNEAFDVLILADLLFNHSEHAKLLKTVQLTLKKTPTAKAYVFFTPYRPWLLEKDLAFFDLARESGFAVEKTFEKVMEKVMFENDPGVRKPLREMNILLIAARTSNCAVLYLDTRLAGLDIIFIYLKPLQCLPLPWSPAL